MNNPHSVPLVKMTPRGQLTVPTELRKKLGFRSGDLFGVVVKENNEVIFKPKAVFDRDSLNAALAEGLADIAAGRVIGPFKSGTEFHKYITKKHKK